MASNLVLILEMTQYLQKMLRQIQVNTKVNTRVLHLSNPRKGFTPVLSDWIKGLVLIFGVTQR